MTPNQALHTRRVAIDAVFADHRHHPQAGSGTASYLANPAEDAIDSVFAETS